MDNALDTRSTDRDALWDIAASLTADGYETLGRYFVYNEGGFIPAAVFDTDGCHDYSVDELAYVAETVTRHDAALGKAFRLGVVAEIVVERQLSAAAFLGVLIGGVS